MNKFGLEEKYLSFIKNILIKNVQAKFYIFGSRAKNTYKEYSDIDIAIDRYGEKLPETTLTKISAEFENSTLPYEVDVVDLNSVTEQFRNLIKESLVEF